MRRLSLKRILLLALALCVLPNGAEVLPSSPLTAKTIVRVMSYNIHVGVGMDKRLDLRRIADIINNERPDLVGLQEVDRGVERTQRRDEIAQFGLPGRTIRRRYSFSPHHSVK
jgi:hypothetical protein